MPVVAMAVPVERSNIYLLPEPNNIESQNTQQRANYNKVTITKAIELILLCISLLFLHLGTIHMQNQSDPIICVIFGSYLIFPILILNGAVKDNHKTVIVFNYLGALLFLIIGVISVFGWMSSHLIIEETINLPPEMYSKTQYCVNMKLTSGIFALLNGAIYFMESVFMTLNIWYNYVV